MVETVLPSEAPSTWWVLSLSQSHRLSLQPESALQPVPWAGPSGVQSSELWGPRPASWADGWHLCLLGLVHVGDELREVNGIAVLHKRPDEISQILVRAACALGVLRRPKPGASRGQGSSGSGSLFSWKGLGKSDLTVCWGCRVGAGEGDRKSGTCSPSASHRPSLQHSHSPALFPEDLRRVPSSKGLRNME